MKTKTKQIFKTAITIPILLLMMLLSFSVHAQTHVYNETTASGIFPDPDGALVANPLSDAFNSSANCARAATGGFGKLQIFPTYTPGAADRLYFSIYNPGGASFAQVKFEYTGAPGVWEDGGDVYYGSASTSGWVEYSIGLAPNEGNSINKIILMPSGSSSVAVYADNIYFHTTSLYPTSGATHFFKDVVENGSLFNSGAGIFNNPLPADPINSTAKCLRTNGTGAWLETQVFNARYVIKTGDKLFVSFYNPNNATQWQLRFTFRDGDYLGPADTAHVTAAGSGWNEVSVDLTSYIGKEIEKIHLYSAHDELKQVYSDNIYIGSASVIPQQPVVYNETISSGMFFQGTNGAQVSNPVSDAVNSSSNVARSATDGSWQQIQYFPNYTVAAGNKLYFSVHNPNGATFGQVQFEYTTGGGWQSGGDVTYVSGSTTGWREYSIDLTGHVGNTINKIILMPAGDSSAAVYVDTIYFGSTSILPPAPQEPIVYNETISSGMFIDGDGSPVANPVKDLVNFSANCAKSGTGGWKKIEYFPTYTSVSGSKLYFSVYNPNNAGPGQVKFDYSTGETEQWGGNVDYISSSVTGWVEYSVDLTAHVGKTITKILMYPSGGSSIAAYIDNVYFGTSSIMPQASTFCKGAATVTIAKGTTDLQLYTSPTSVALAGTTVLTSKVYYATLNGSARTALTVTVNNLPATPSALSSLEARNICKYIGSSTPVTFTATAVNASSYIWSAPAGATIDADGAQAFISFENVSTTPGLIGSVSVQIQDANGCISASKALALTTKVPTAPTSLTMTSTDSTPHFKGIITPAVVNPPTPAVTGLVGLNSLTTGIKKVGPYVGTDTVFTLTAPVAITAASYAWTLPTGVYQLSGDNSNVITVDFADVEPGIGSLPIVVQSVGGCGNSINRTLTLARALPSAPTKLVLTDDAISTTTAVTKVGPYTGKSTELTLTATPFTTQGSTATSYAWILPAGVTCLTDYTEGTVSQLVNTGSVEVPVMTPTAFDAIFTTTSTITIDLFDVASGVTSLPIKVFGVNGAGNSIARTLALTAAVPATPAIVGSLGTGSATQFSSCATKTYTATLIPGATYAWTLPAGADIVGAADGNVIVVDYSNTTVAIGATGAAVTCTAINGTGPSVTKSLTVKRVVCPAPGKIAPEAATTEKFNAVAYPNPSTEGFRVKSSNGKSFGVQVYDMLGRSIEQHQMSSDAQIGSNYAKGIYNVIVSQGANVKTLRVIKK